MQNAECRMQNAECKMQNAECRMQNAECRMQNGEWGNKKAAAFHGNAAAWGDQEMVTETSVCSNGLPDGSVTMLWEPESGCCSL